MKKYEYKVDLKLDTRRGSSAEEEYLNKMGLAGYELCSVVVSMSYSGDTHYYFKREMPR